MAIEIRVPDLGKEVEEATIIRWQVKEGDTVAEGDVILELATGKVDTEVTAPAAGTVLKILGGDGEGVKAGEVIGWIGHPEDEVEDVPPADESAPVVTSAAPRRERVRATPVARRMAEEAGIDLAAVPGSGPGGQVTKADVARYLAAQEASSTDGTSSPEHTTALPEEFADVASLSVRRLAADFNVNLREVAQGRPLSQLTRFDVLAYVAQQKGLTFLPTEPRYPLRPPAVQESEPPSSPAPETVEASRVEEDTILVPHTRMRRLIAENTARSAFTAPHVTTVWDVDMSAVLAHYRRHKDAFTRRGVRLTLTAYFVKALVAGVRAVPAANGSWTEEGILISRRVHVGLAVAIPPDEHGLGGLVVPVIRDAHELTLEGIARRIQDLVTRAREQRLTPEDLKGGTITLTNYGVGGSRLQTPIIVHPQAAILGVGTVEKRPVVLSREDTGTSPSGDALVFVPMVTLALSYDHRVLDGATADLFCRAVKDALEHWPLEGEIG